MRKNAKKMPRIARRSRNYNQVYLDFVGRVADEVIAMGELSAEYVPRSVAVNAVQITVRVIKKHIRTHGMKNLAMSLNTGCAVYKNLEDFE